MALNRSDLTLPAAPRETVAVPALGGDVIVRGMLLNERLELFSGLRNETAGYGHIARLLAPVVIGEDGKPLLTVEEWEAFGGANFAEVLDLFNVARRLSGLDSEEVEKN